MLKRLSLSPIFPLADLMAEAFYWLSLWNFKKYNINRPLWRSLLKTPNRGKFPSSRRLLSAGAPRHQKNRLSFTAWESTRTVPASLLSAFSPQCRETDAEKKPPFSPTRHRPLRKSWEVDGRGSGGGRRNPFFRKGSSALPRDVASTPSPKSTSGPRRNRRTRGGR